MNRLSIPNPPSADSPEYRSNPAALQRALVDWMQRSKGVLENAHNQLAAPCAQQMVVGSFTTNTTITGTTTGTDLANVVASLMQTLTAKGLLSPTISRGQNQ